MISGVSAVAARQLDGLFLTDDGDAAALARRHHITAVATWDLLRLAHKTNKVTRPVLTGYLRRLKGAGRGQPRGITSLDDLTPWLPAPE